MAQTPTLTDYAVPLLPFIEEIIIEDKLYRTPSLTLTDVARVVCSNRSYVSAAISAKYGSFLKFINILRIQEAIKIQKHEPHTEIIEICQRVGYRSHSTYYRWLAWYRAELNKIGKDEDILQKMIKDTYKVCTKEREEREEREDKE